MRSYVASPKRKTKRRDAGRPRGEPIEAAVLARTLEEILEHGIDGVSVDRIARDAEVNKTSVYRRFGTREGLIAAALERVAGDVSAKLADQGSLRNDLRHLAEHVAALLGSPLGKCLARAALSSAADSEVAALASREMQRPRAAALAMVTRARARGEWRSDVAPEVVLAALVGGMLHRALLERAPLSRSFLQQLVDMLARGVAVEA